MPGRARKEAGRTAVAARTATIAALALAGLGALAPLASAAPPPGSPAYRHGQVPALVPGGARQGASVSPSALASHRFSGAATQRLTASANNLSYQGGVEQVGVTTGAPRVYLVFWGSQWGTQTTDAQGRVALSGDANGMAPRLQSFFAGLGTNGELWSGVMTQYCQGVPVGTQFCPAGSAVVGYPSGGALAGVYVDESSAAPSQASAHQLAQEAVNAAGHFGNTTAAANRNVQYFIVSPSGTHPDGFSSNSNFCAWHDYSGDPYLGGGAVTSPYGDVAFTNMPYVTDHGGGCGENFVNSGTAGLLDGVTIVGGHEYAETITDQFPVGGWIDSGGNETGDKCAWIASGQGASTDLALATGSFAVQSTWANDFNGGAGGCETSHPIVTSAPPPPDYSLGISPSSQTVTQGSGTSYGVSVSDTGGFNGAVTLSVAGLPAGASGSFTTNPATSSSTLNVATGTAAAGTYPLTITGVSGSDTHTVSATLVVRAPAPQPSFTLVASPTSRTVNPGGGTNYGLTVKALNGFTGRVTLSLAGLPSGVSASFGPNPATTTSKLNLKTTHAAPAGTYRLTITGVSGSLRQTVTVTLILT